MKLIVGLGNPGSEYASTRHNAGFMALDRVAERAAPGGLPRSKFNSLLLEGQLAGDRVLLLKPLTYMNRSGAAVAETLNFYKLSPKDDLLVLVDEYQLPLGSLRIRPGGSPGGHNGLTDIERALGTQEYPRLRIGIDPPPPGYDDPAAWVLGRFTTEQQQTLRPALNRIVDAVELFVQKGVSAAMNKFNTRENSSTPAPKPTPPVGQISPPPSPKSPPRIDPPPPTA